MNSANPALSKTRHFVGRPAPRKSNAYAKSTEANFGEIDRKRGGTLITESVLCRAAGISATTYWRSKNGGCLPQRRTLVKLRRALETLTDDKALRATGVVEGFYRSAAVVFAREIGADIAAVLRPARSNSNFNCENAKAGRARQLAFYLTVNAYDVRRSGVAAIAGYSKQAASKALKTIEDARAQDDGLDRLILRVGLLLTGRDLT